MWGQISRTVSFDLNSRQESNYCLGSNTSEFTLTIDTKLENIDSLKGYDISIKYDANKIRILQVSKIGTLSKDFANENFSFKNPERGMTEVIGFSGLSKNSPNIVGEGALFALRGEWIDSKCTDSTTIRIGYLDPSFEFGIGPRFVNVDSSVTIYNRNIDTIETRVSILDEDTIEDTLSFDQNTKSYTIAKKISFGKSTANDSVIVYVDFSTSIDVKKVEIDSVMNIIASIDNGRVIIRKTQRGLSGYLNIHFEVDITVDSDTTQHVFSTYTKRSQCDCSQTMDSSINEFILLRMKKPDTIINSLIDENLKDAFCTDYYDILGRFIESDCPNDESTKAITRRRAFRLGKDYIQYIDSK
jgi:hypothetical protein